VFNDTAKEDRGYPPTRSLWLRNERPLSFPMMPIFDWFTAMDNTAVSRAPVMRWHAWNKAMACEPII
jgi:hypothetical protein